MIASDDNCACDYLESELCKILCARYYVKYRELAAKVGVSLASEDNKSKAFGPSTVGEVLGLDYDSEKGRNWIPQDKSARLIRELCEIMDMKGATNEDWMKVSGKLNHYHPLVKNG